MKWHINLKLGKGLFTTKGTKKYEVLVLVEFLRSLRNLRGKIITTIYLHGNSDSQHICLAF